MRKRAARFLLMLFAVASALAAAAGCSHNQGPGADAAFDPIRLGIDFYRGPLDHLSAVRTGTCPMHPGCSAYSRAAVEKHGPVIGWIMACDRLMRCGRDELRRTRPAWIDGERRFPDPLVRNDWWWNAPDNMDPLGSGRTWQVRVESP
jgi:hypothetical protein